MSTFALAASPRRSASPHAATVRWLLRQQLRPAVWAVAILAVLVTSATVAVDAFADVEISIVQFGRQAFAWFPFSVAVVTAYGAPAVHVAAGVTRATLGRATVLVALVMAGVYTLTMTAALQLERAVYGALGWTQQITEATQVFDDTSQVGWILVDLGLLFTAAQLSGLLVGLIYYRGGGWWGTLTLPLTVGTVLLVTPLLTTPLLDPIAQEARVPIAAALLVAVAAAYVVLLRGAPIRSDTT